MSRFSFAVGNGSGQAPASVDTAASVPTFQTGLPAEASTLMAVVVVEAILITWMRHYFRHYHGG